MIMMMPVSKVCTLTTVTTVTTVANVTWSPGPEKGSHSGLRYVTVKKAL